MRVKHVHKDRKWADYTRVGVGWGGECVAW